MQGYRKLIRFFLYDNCYPLPLGIAEINSFTAVLSLDRYGADRFPQHGFSDISCNRHSGFRVTEHLRLHAHFHELRVVTEEIADSFRDNARTIAGIQAKSSLHDEGDITVFLNTNQSRIQ